MRIKLTSHQHGPHEVGSTHEVDHVIPHGGNTDSARQYVLADGTHVASDHAEVVPPRPSTALANDEQRANARAARKAHRHRMARARRFTDEGQAIWS